jgi:hypothetical protein
VATAAPRAARLASLASGDGYGVYGLAAGAVMRGTPSDARPWSLALTPAPREVIPQPDGAALVIADRGTQTVVWRVRPPEPAAGDSAVLPRVGRAISSPSGDQLYFVTDSGLVGLRSRTLEPIAPIRFAHRVRDAAATPSGDRLYVATDSASAVQVVNRYQGEITARVPLPGGVAELRMDALGRYLLARPVTGDSAWVVDIGTNRLLGTMRTAWRADLPLVLPDGAIAALRGADVVLVDGATLEDRQTVRGGGADLWHVVPWNGFRPRADTTDTRVAAADRPAAAEEPATADSVTGSTAAAAGIVADSASSSAAVDSTAIPTAPAPPGATAQPPAVAGTTTAAPPAPAARVFTVQFAAVRSEAAARDVVAAMRPGGPRPRIVATQTSGTTLYRVVLGPYSSQGEADRVGKQLGRDYWVYEGEP